MEGKMTESKGTITNFMGIEPSKPGEYWTSNRHHCMGQAQIRVTINNDGSFETYCPTCGANPAVLYEMGQFYYAANVIGVI
jgi:hypothetical protein